MKLLAKSLKLSNFKGVRQFSLMFNDTETRVYGANGTGKSTLSDAFFFVFTGTDSQGKQAKEWVQTLDENNEKVHKLDHEAEVVIKLEGDQITLGRKVAEKWVKPRGAKEAVLDESLDYTYYIDGVATPKTKFEKFIIDTVFDGRFTVKEFMLLSNPLAFCNLDWKLQREILYKVCGSATDEEIIATDERFNFLIEALKHKDVESLKSALRKTISTTKKEIEALEAVIKDRKNSLIQEYTRQDVEMEKAEKEEHIKSLQDQLKADEGKFQELREKQQEILKIEQQLEQAKKEHFNSFNKEVTEAKEQLVQIETDIFNQTLKKDRTIKQLEAAKQDLEIIEGKTIPEFRERWNFVKEKCMSDEDKECPHCGQYLPEDKLQEVLASFDLKKKQQLDTLITESLKIKSERELKENIVANCEDVLEQLEEILQELNENRAKINDVICQEREIKPFDDTPYTTKIAALQKEIDEFKEIDNSSIKEQIEIANKDLQMIAIKLSKCDTYDKAVNEIASKEDELKEKQLSLADIEIELMSVEDFVTTKVKMLEEKVNSKFENVKFKLFKRNQNGSVEETCIALAKAKNGALVDIKDSLANKALIYQAGIEIVNVLQRHFDFYCPVIIDNKESVTKVPGVEGQMLQLIVSENDEELRVE